MDWRVRQGTDPGCAIGGASCPISDRSPLHRLRVPQVSILRPGIPRNSIASFKITRWATYARLRKLDARTTSVGAITSDLGRTAFLLCASARASAAAFSPICWQSWSMLESGTRRKSE